MIQTMSKMEPTPGTVATDKIKVITKLRKTGEERRMKVNFALRVLCDYQRAPKFLRVNEKQL